MHNATQKYIKSFNKGQITVPKEFRDKLELGDSFWLKMFIKNDSLVAEPVPSEEQSQPESYAQKLLHISGDWFDAAESTAVKKAVNKRAKKYL